MFRKFIKSLLHRLGFDVVRYQHTLEWRQRLLFSHYNVDLIFDVGANTGQYAAHIRQFGYRGRIISFEPLSSAYKELVENARRDPLWETQNIAMGNYDGKTKINISKNSVSSSILEMLPSHIESAPESIYVGKEEIVVRRIDSIIDDYCHAGEKVYLKIDAQGYGKHIIYGAKGCLGRLNCIEIEASLVPLYEGETLLAGMISFMSDKGYTLISLDPDFYDQGTGQLLQVNCIFGLIS